MATKQEIIDTQNRLALEQSQLVGYWAKTQGITQKDLESHPCIDDLILLINFRNEFWSDMTQGQRLSWQCHWDWVYFRKNTIRKKHLKKLENIIISAINTKLFKSIRRSEQRQRIHHLRQQKNPTALGQNKISAENMTAKDAGSSQSVPWD